MTGTYAFPVQRYLIGRVVATAGAALAMVGTFLPWLRSGTRRRNSYEIFSLVERLGISQSSIVGWGLRLWPIVPLLLVLAVTFQWFPRRLVTPAFVIIAVVYAGGVAVAVAAADSTSLIAVEYGPAVTLIGAILLIAGALLTAIPGTRLLSNRQ
jgi:heme A synthase